MCRFSFYPVCGQFMGTGGRLELRHVGTRPYNVPRQPYMDAFLSALSMASDLVLEPRMQADV